jgi:hypothetical protein
VQWWFNKTHDRVGHLFQGRFKGTLVEKEAELLNVIRYVALNAVDAGMVERPEDDRWGSYRAHAGYEAAPEWLASEQLLGHFAPDRRIAQQLYRTFVADGIGKDHDIWPRVVGQIYLGGQQWIEQMRARVESKPRRDEHPRAQRAPDGGSCLRSAVVCGDLNRSKCLCINDFGRDGTEHRAAKRRYDPFAAPLWRWLTAGTGLTVDFGPDLPRSSLEALP